ncbi:hydrolase 1, exosortase A system-associated [Erythrobacter sp. KY5]|uniref:hydrolase 1, exosortase A system-associated n=1 Tax=Erythrobacter sp. KY5 TaxID=2011159 RepID=UPI000DBEF5D5|nr:hydrolase 1, exosortase A system-associated [Erythrobacter sp. KY5]AWW74907.1 hydrolase 1, exosortase A system-associated [Erythrobacter sp. KY5]
MSRLHFQFGCGSLKLAGSLDTAPGSTGLLLVSGGNEIRSGAFSGQSHLAAAIASKGFPVFRFDRRGIGGSEGENRGFRSSAKDIRAALEAFRGMVPQMDRVFAFGNCDAASALMLTGGERLEGLILSNPWTIESNEEEGDAASNHTPDAIRARYAEKLRNPREIARLLRGGVDLRKLGRGVLSSLRPAPAPSTLAQEMKTGLDDFEGHVAILLATADRTAQLFEAAWESSDPRIARCEGAGHSYVDDEHREWLEAQILIALRS